MVGNIQNLKIFKFEWSAISRVSKVAFSAKKKKTKMSEVNLWTSTSLLHDCLAIFQNSLYANPGVNPLSKSLVISTCVDSAMSLKDRA